MNSSRENRCDCISIDQAGVISRRQFFTSASSGLGAAALVSLLQSDRARGLSSTSSYQARLPHESPRAKRCIFIFLAGGTSQIELFDPKPELVARTGQHLPESF